MNTKKKETKEKVIVSDLRANLKNIIQSEIERLPELLEELEPKDRLNFVLKLMPFVFPKTKSISHTIGEPLNWD